MHSDTHRILVVDDDFDEQFLTQRSLRKAISARSSIALVGSGNEAIAYMMGEGKYSDRSAYPFPSLLIVDLNMDDGDGFDVLEFVQGNPGWHVLPRVVFSSSDDDDDIRTAYLLGASSYHLKPSGSAALDKRMREIVEYWAAAELPPVDENGRLLATNSAGRRGARYPQPCSAMRMKRPVPNRSTDAARRSAVSEKSAK